MDVDAMAFPAYRPTATESTRLKRGSDTHMRKVVATKTIIRLYDGRPTNGVVDDDDDVAEADCWSFLSESSSSRLAAI